MNPDIIGSKIATILSITASVEYSLMISIFSLKSVMNHLRNGYTFQGLSRVYFLTSCDTLSLNAVIQS